MKKLFYKSYLFIVIIFISFCLAESHAQTMSTEDLLEYSLDSLREKMDSALKQNKDFSSKNSSIRQRILSLKKEAREFDDRKIRLIEEGVDIKSKIKLSAKELKIEEKRLNNNLERKRHLAFERDSLKKQIETTVLERKMLEQDVNETSFDVQALKGDSTGQITSSLIDYYSEEKLKFLEMLKESRARLDVKRGKIDLLEIQLADRYRSSQVGARQQESLKRTLNDLELRLKEETSKTALLKKSSEAYRNDAKKQHNSFADKNQQRRQYIKMLGAVINDLQAGRQDFLNQYQRDEEGMRGYLALLQEENNLLFKIKEKAEKESLQQQRNENADHAVLMLQQQLEEIEEARERAANDRRANENALTLQQKENESLGRNIERFKGSLDELAEDVARVKQSVAVIREDAFGDKKEEIQKALTEQTVRIQKIEEEMSLAKQEMMAENQLLNENRQQAKDNEKQLSARQQELKDLQAEHRKLLTQQQSIEKTVSNQQVLWQKEINEALMRKKALEASVDVVRQKYQAGESELSNFKTEQIELQGYLDVLKRENSSLQKKVSVLEARKQ